MPANISSGSSCSTCIKVVSVPKEGAPPGLPGTTLLLDEITGKTKAVVNASALTGLRTAAGSALSLQTLVSWRKEAHNLVVFGGGVQAYHHIRLMAPLLPALHRICIVNRSRERLEGLKDQVQEEYPELSVQAVLLADHQAVEKAVTSADVLCLCTPATSPLFSHKLLKPRCHLTAIGSYKPHMREFDLEALMQDDPHMNVYVDSAEACMAEAGELQFLAKDDRRVVELIDATEQQEGRTIYKSVGVGSMDVMITKVVVEAAIAKGIGQFVDF